MSLYSLVSAWALALIYRRRSTFPLRGRPFGLLLLSVACVVIFMASPLGMLWLDPQQDPWRELFVYLYFAGMAGQLIAFAAQTWILLSSFRVAEAHLQKQDRTPEQRARLQRQVYHMSPRFMVPAVAVAYAATLTSYCLGNLLEIVPKAAVHLSTTGTATLVIFYMAFLMRHFPGDNFHVKSELRARAAITTVYVIVYFIVSQTPFFLEHGVLYHLLGSTFIFGVHLVLGILQPLYISYRTEQLLHEQARPLDRILGSKQEPELRLFLALEFCEESLNFYNDVQAFFQEVDVAQLSGQTPDIRGRVRYLYDTYISEAAPNQVNVDSRTRKTCLRLLTGEFDAKQALAILRSAQAEVFRLLQRDVMPRYQKMLVRKARQSTLVRHLPFESVRPSDMAASKNSAGGVELTQTPLAPSFHSNIQ